MLKSLTKSENEVVKLKALGYLEKEIADIRCVSIHTVKTQVKRAVKKSKAKSTYHLVALYAAIHTELFKTFLVLFFLSLQGMMTVSDYEEDYRKPVRQNNRRVKTSRRKGKSKVLKI